MIYFKECCEINHYLFVKVFLVQIIFHISGFCNVMWLADLGCLQLVLYCKKFRMLKKVWSGIQLTWTLWKFSCLFVVLFEFPSLKATKKCILLTFLLKKLLALVCSIGITYFHICIYRNTLLGPRSPLGMGFSLTQNFLWIWVRM